MATRRRLATAVALVAALVLAACTAGGDGDAETTAAPTTDRSQGGPTTTGPLGSEPTQPPPGIRIEVLSSQPDRVTGDEARIRVTPPDGSDPDEVALTLDDRDVTDQLAVVGDALEGVVTGFIEGNNTLRASAGDDAVVQRVRAWPRTGPVFSGPHLPLLACATEAFELGPPTDADCSAAPVTTDGTIDDSSELRVRRERGVVNRSTYEIAWADADPSDEAPTGWNGALVLRFSGGPDCTGLYGQGVPGVTAADPRLLQAGYVVATASFTDASVTCNDVLAAETAMMVRERVIEAFGVPEITIGDATSGGGALAHLLTQDYPGLINGAVVSEGFADLVTAASGAADCRLLEAYAGTDAGRALHPLQRAEIAGHASAATCATWAGRFGGALDPTVGCDPAIAAADRYDPAANRGGVRCTLADAARNQSLTDPDTGWALPAFDNVGIQYGLEALNAGVIEVDEFLDLNAGIGGLDGDGRPAELRTEADPEAVLHAYETGRVSMGGGDQAE
ncbi:MAG: hypothetical protein KDA97_05175, partial [Acidimicrobiales bacterium]|nr:hypothetical protein [Acidimicrobiales bacterium]